MPTYEFECSGCGLRFEKFLAITDDSPHECPVCKNTAKRLISTGAGLIFKGSGFYVNDYRKPEKASQKK